MALPKGMRTGMSTPRNMFDQGIAPKARRQVKMRAKHEPGQMNRTEAAFAQQLEARRLAGEIAGWWFEAIKVRAGSDQCWMIFDFFVVRADGQSELIDVKGNGPLEDDALVKLKAIAARYWPFHVRMAIGVCRRRLYTFTYREFSGDDPTPLPYINGKETDDAISDSDTDQGRHRAALRGDLGHETEVQGEADRAPLRRAGRDQDPAREAGDAGAAAVDGTSRRAAGEADQTTTRSNIEKTEREGHCKPKRAGKRSTRSEALNDIPKTPAALFDGDAPRPGTTPTTRAN